jgi:hypothetical protein
MKPRIYLDTSVFGGYFDHEFAKFTIPFFELILAREFIILFSSLTRLELEPAPEKVKNLLKTIDIKLVEFIELDDVSSNLANQYINQKVVGKTSLPDCQHIAMATVNEADFLVSWNFKHIVNVQRIHGFNSINLGFGHKVLDIRSPREFNHYEKD